MRAANPADSDGVIDRLKDIGYLDDRRFAESFAAARVENEGFGRMRVLNDLRARRVSGDMAEQAVVHAIGDKSEAELIDAFIDRRMHSLAVGGPIEDEKKLAAAYRKLRRAGFSSGPDPVRAEAHRGPAGYARRAVGGRGRGLVWLGYSRRSSTQKRSASLQSRDHRERF